MVASLSAVTQPTTHPARRRSVRLPSGSFLPIELAMAPSRSRAGTWVVLAGPVGSGKTTLLQCLYEAYQRGPFGDTRFAGSETLRAFEELSHENRPASGLEIPNTSRTPRTVDGLLHLAVQPLEADEPNHLFFSDISGEPYEEMIDRPALAHQLTALPRADSIAIIIDSGSLIPRAERHRIRFRTEILVRAILERGGVKEDADVDVVLTKWDMAVAAGEPVQRYVRETAAELVSAVDVAHTPSLSLTCGRAAQGSSVATGTGIEDLLKRWCRWRGRKRALVSSTPAVPSLVTVANAQ